MQCFSFSHSIFFFSFLLVFFLKPFFCSYFLCFLFFLIIFCNFIPNNKYTLLLTLFLVAFLLTPFPLSCQSSSNTINLIFKIYPKSNHFLPPPTATTPMQATTRTSEQSHLNKEGSLLSPRQILSPPAQTPLSQLPSLA